MKVIQVFFLLVSFSIFKVLYANTESTVTDFEFPTLESPDIEFKDLSGGCASFFDCTEYLANVVFNIGAGFIFLVLFFINLLVYFFGVLAIILAAAFLPIEGAPFYVNGLITLFLMGSLAFIVYKLIRSGSSES